jgi:hypothetical protein
MNDDELRALADRVVACRHWRPMPGMRDLQGRTWTPDLLWRWHPHDRPDLSDPATVGCLLALVREAYGDERLACVPWRRGWAVDRVWLRSGRLSHATTEAEALVAALESAP